MQLRYPYYWCAKCDYAIAELQFPIHPNQQYPFCPKCHSNEHVDIVLGDENTVLDADMVIFDDGRDD